MGGWGRAGAPLPRALHWSPSEPPKKFQSWSKRKKKKMRREEKEGKLSHPPPLGTRNDEINIELPLLSYKLTIMVTVFQI
jgi:hypothetical protein